MSPHSPSSAVSGQRSPASLLLHAKRDQGEPLAGEVWGLLISLAALVGLTAFLTQRYLAVKVWKKIPFVIWSKYLILPFLARDRQHVDTWRRRTAVFAVLVDSWVFVFATIILSHGSGVNWADRKNCSAAIIICLTLYVITKLISHQSICLFLNERAVGHTLLPQSHVQADLTCWSLQFIVRNSPKRRLESKLYAFNSAGLVLYIDFEAGAYIVVKGFVAGRHTWRLTEHHSRISRLENGRCIIGARRSVLVPLVFCDVLANIYLTTLFLIPLRNLNSAAGMLRTSANARLRSIALRTFIGACCTATSSIIDHYRPDALSGGYSMSEAGPYDTAGRRSSATTWCYRRPGDGTTRAASLMMRSRRGSAASGHNNSSSSDYHEAVASAGPIHWDNIFTLFGNEDGHDKQQVAKEVTPSTLEAAATAAAGGDSDAPGTVDTTTRAAAVAAAAATTDCHPLQRPKPSRTLSSIHSIRSVMAGDPSPEEVAQGLEAGEGEEKVGGKMDEIT
ncbi:hypothetical protein PG985_009136 [Apiospora marii]|uniref:uncharacterized protein n=1 Tax=Apiospora marii TaxID=335849 RepID=UPI00312E3B8C